MTESLTIMQEIIRSKATYNLHYGVRPRLSSWYSGKSYYGQKSASGQKVAVPEVQQVKTVVTHGKHREKWASSQECTSDRVVVENNSLSDIAQAQSEGKTLEQKAGEQVESENERYKKANCGGMSAEACSVKMYEERREALKETVSLGADFVPVVGDIKSFVEADSALGYLAAVVGLMGPLGDAAGKAIKNAEKALKAGDLETASKLINKASDEIQAVKALDVGSYNNLKKGEVVGDGLEHDHIPSFAALKKAKENEIGRPLTDAETKKLYQNATAVEVPKDVHQAGSTYGGKNTAAQVEQDALDLCGAVCRDTDALRGNMIERGYDPKQVDEAIEKIIDRNRQIGVIK